MDNLKQGGQRKNIGLIIKIVMTISLALFFIKKISFEMHEVKKNTLNFFMPREFKVFSEAIYNDVNFHQDALVKYQNYYRKIAEYMPYRAEAYGLLGFCSYYLGDKEKAIKSYIKAIELNPDFFWYYYNLGIIYWKSHQWQLSRQYLQKAIQVKPQETLKFIYSSQMIYLPIIKDRGYDFKKISEELQKGYEKGYQFSMISKYIIGNPKLAKNINTQRVQLGVY